MAESTIEINRNPDGRRNPVFFDQVIQKKDGTIVKRRVQIVESRDQLLNFIAVDPQTQREIELRATDWRQIYPSHLNRPAPEDLESRVRQYYRIRQAKAKSKSDKSKTAA